MVGISIVLEQVRNSIEIVSRIETSKSMMISLGLQLSYLSILKLVYMIPYFEV